ncbi:MAG: PrsW family intramembrane metalloprotease [Planctomycetaceae bacterium]|jgi:RsiW-degrading membrane proteinase PrsW (M82 family)|nr:PrsW family intramembrane metalloprotease [Planctomycetaceae bacterium]
MAYYVKIRGKAFGPFDDVQIQDLIQKGKVGKTTEISQDRVNWTRAEENEMLFPKTAAAQSIPQPPATEPQIPGQWYYSNDGQTGYGPYAGSTIAQMIRSGQILANSLLWQENGQPEQAQRIPAFHSVFYPPNTSVYSGVSQNVQPNVPPSIPTPSITDIPREKISDVFLFTAENIQKILLSPIFWVVMVLGVLPLVIISVDDPSGYLPLVGMLFFFGFLWGGIFRSLVIKSNDKLYIPITAMFFTGIIGLAFLLPLTNLYMRITEHDNLILSLLGFIFGVGICEELCKIAPVGIYMIVMLICQKKPSLTMILLIGVFSGLGFSVYENKQYVENHIIKTLLKLDDAQNAEDVIHTIIDGIMSAMILVMLRSLTCVFGHAVWSGIFSYFIAMSYQFPRRVFLYLPLGLGITAFLHGFYDWLFILQPTYPAFIAVASFVLFYGYCIKVRSYMEPHPLVIS